MSTVCNACLSKVLFYFCRGSNAFTAGNRCEVIIAQPLSPDTFRPISTMENSRTGSSPSALIIGSAAGVAAMGMEKIDFFWYLRRITGWAVLGYLAGAAVFLLQNALFA